MRFLAKTDLPEFRGRRAAFRSAKIRALAARGLLGVLLLVGPVALASAQEVRVQVSRAPHYLGEPFEVQVIATDFEEEPTPEVVPGEMEGGRLRYVGVSPTTSTSISIINGKMTRVHEVTFVYRYEVTGTRRGQLEIPAFRVVQAGTQRHTRAFDVQINAVPTNESIGIDVELPEGPIFVGQKVPVTIEFRIERSAQQDLLNYHIEVPLFDVPHLRFLDSAPPGADTNLEIQTAKGSLRLPATSEERSIDGRPTLIVRAQRTLVALSPQALHADPPTVFIEQGTRFRRDLFNQRQATASQKFMASGDPVRIEVAEVPREGRPASFAGAIGEGFTLEVTADRSVVQLGEPIEVSFLLRGNGDLSMAGLPPLDAEGLFDPTRFRLPEEPPAGLIDDEGKRFEVVLRVLDANVREIPALSYSWFDAESRRFETTRSRPIALSVGAAEIIGADAVTRRAESGSGKAELEEAGARSDAAGETPDRVRQTSLLASGANLAVERDVEALLAGPRSSSERSTAVVAGLYTLGLAFLAFAFIDRRRRDVDPARLERERAFAQARRAIDGALAQTGPEAVAALGRALRELVARVPEEAGAEFDALLAECDALQFAPEGRADEAVPAALAERARRFVAAPRSEPAFGKAGS